ncbi:hypothetical protein I3842_07G090100 [Carya illinoinensis]|uniref:Uncharacterized protein n=1 Tax=Carya illinoinensis TaxID=32201 RepID=A0A922EJ35_CARIL|nr:hypothetical protein I3842_07G090100 [Carya illinoinensis]
MFSFPPNVLASLLQQLNVGHGYSHSEALAGRYTQDRMGTKFFTHSFYTKVGNISKNGICTHSVSHICTKLK